MASNGWCGVWSGIYQNMQFEPFMLFTTSTVISDGPCWHQSERYKLEDASLVFAFPSPPDTIMPLVYTIAKPSLPSKLNMPELKSIGGERNLKGGEMVENKTEVAKEKKIIREIKIECLVLNDQFTWYPNFRRCFYKWSSLSSTW